MRRFARLGAMKRLEDIRREEASIRAAFPELFAGEAPRRGGRKAAKGAKAAKSASGATAATSAAPRAARKRSTMSPAMRKAVSERMKKYWAGRRKSKNG